MKLKTQFENQGNCGGKRHNLALNLSSRLLVDDILETQVKKDNGTVECDGSPVTCFQDPAACANIT